MAIAAIGFTVADTIIASTAVAASAGSAYLASCSGTPANAYAITAVPLAVGQSGVRRFCSDQTNIIRYERDADCNPASSSPVQ